MSKKQIHPVRERDLDIDPRYVNMNREKAIRDIYDALVEIITNSDDSYHRLFDDKKRQTDGGDIRIEITRRRGNSPSLVVVKDRAEGMTIEDMWRKLGRYGARTAGDDSRGFMGRGLKDCLALGDIQVESVVGDKYYACRLFTGDDRQDVLRELSAGSKADAALMKKLGLRRKETGTMVTLEYGAEVSLPQVATLVKNLPLHYALRDIVSTERKSKIQITDGTEPKILDPYSPTGELREDFLFEVDGYPDSKCRLRIWKSARPLADLDSRRMRQSGILVVGGRAIHQCTLAGHDGDDLAKYYYGRLDCDYIQKLLNEYDERGSSRAPRNSANPFVLIDPNRQSGLDKRHPFAEKLLAKIGEHLKRLVDEDRSSSVKKGDVSDQKMRKDLDELASLADRFRKKYIDEPESPGEDDFLDNAKENGLCIVPPRFNIRVGEVRSLTVYVRDDCYDKNRKTRIRTGDEGIISLDQGFSGRALKVHPRAESVFYGSCRVRGVALGVTKITVRPCKAEAINAVGTVVEDRGEEHDFTEPLEFERKKYAIPEGKSKKLRILARLSVLSAGDNVVKVWCTDQAVSVKSGGKCRLHRRQGTNYAEGEIEIEGRNVTERAVKISAEMGDATAKTSVKVVHRKGGEGGFRFDLVDKLFGFGDLRARWADLEGKPSLLEISAVHPSIKRYFGGPPKFPQQKDPQSRVLLAEIITESVCLRILREEMRARPGSFSFEGKDPREILDEINSHLQKRMSEFATKAHKIFGEQ